VSELAVPLCCYDCQHHDDDYSEWYDRTYHFCLLGLFFPTKKQTCKKQRPYPVNLSHPEDAGRGEGAG
jgi:hypothetical protein